MSRLDTTADHVGGLEERQVQREAGRSSARYVSDVVVTRRELWSYYLYINGNCGIIPFIYTMTFFQALLTAAGHDPVAGPGSPCKAAHSAGRCVVPWGNGTKPVSSVVLVANSICFAVMTFVFTTISAAADYGNLGRWLLLVASVICWGSQLATMSLTGPSRWPVAFVLYVINFTSFGITLVFYIAMFPRLARSTTRTLEMRDKFITAQINKQEYDVEESMEKNRISNTANMNYTIGFAVMACLNLALLTSLKGNPLADNYAIVMMTIYGILTGVWWFIFQQPRPGPPLPKGENYFTIGWKQIWSLRKEYRKLPQLFRYLLAFFLLADGFNTTGTLISVLQNDKLKFSFLKGTYLGLAQAAASVLGTFGFWRIQRYWKISTKSMLVVTNLVTIAIPLWGMLGIWTDKIGFHSLGEFWAYNVVFGLFQAPYFAYSQTMMAEISPPGFEYLFFGLLGLSNRASSMIGPNVVQAIVNRTGNNWTGFPFLFALCTLASLMIWFGVDVPRGRADARKWAVERRERREANHTLPEVVGTPKEAENHAA